MEKTKQPLKLVSRYIKYWEQCWDPQVCANIPFVGNKCVGAHICVRIIEDNGAGGQRRHPIDRPGQDHQPARSLLHAQAHDRRHEGRDVRATRRNATRSSRTGGAVEHAPRGAAPVRQESRRHGRRHHAGRPRRRDRLRAHGFRRLRHPLDRRAGRDPVQEVRRPSSSCTSKRTRSGSGSTKTSSGGSTTAFSRTAAASRRAACGGCCTGCTTS